jgi:phosphoribosyl-dephospho-CoA transferase
MCGNTEELEHMVKTLNLFNVALPGAIKNPQVLEVGIENYGVSDSDKPITKDFWEKFAAQMEKTPDYERGKIDGLKEAVLLCKEEADICANSARSLSKLKTKLDKNGVVKTAHIQGTINSNWGSESTALLCAQAIENKLKEMQNNAR